MAAPEECGPERDAELAQADERRRLAEEIADGQVGVDPRTLAELLRERHESA